MARNQDRIHKFQKLKQSLENDTYAKSGDKINQSLYLSSIIAQNMCKDLYKGYVKRNLNMPDS